ncbi:hypothetical protein [Catellatospora citrea]|uniref:Uncharacterized protein n=1 Tax=Catellatospora citrea TaxID=53366 RepID=A0A8J3KBD5_9ACTN|nr:hypothetical protein [Catellatospora citrea]RKE11032.1 hypothetical protein C8E86_5952 [Catellatospora citrea]GIF96487.1 hypothetical protein Cci01nite_15810 [Catellatospora citrea]
MTTVYLELGSKRIFACALEWPGWCRSGRDAERALAALTSYAERYAVVAQQAKIPFEPGDVRVVERVRGGTTTDFGAPEQPASADFGPRDQETAQRQAALVRASWDVFADVVAVTPAELRKGPRGGGRDRDKMVDHVIAAEASYARRIGVKHPAPAAGDTAALAALRADILDVLASPSDGTPPPRGGWPPAYTARRIAWHVLDHAWEMQDRATP